MLHVDEQPETLHIYVVREELPPPFPLLPIILSTLSLLALSVCCFLAPYRQLELPVTISVPAVFLPLQTYTVQASIIPTGKKIIPATCAHGILTITNGTIISQTIPQGFRFDGVATDTSVFVPAGSANGYGVTSVAAHSITCGKSGNYGAYTLNYTLGAGVYIRNLTSFSGGRDAYTVFVQLPQDRQRAFDQARTDVTRLVQIKALLAYPCKTLSTENHTAVKLAVTCQFFTYSVSPIVHVSQVRLVGKEVIVRGSLVDRPKPFTGK